MIEEFIEFALEKLFKHEASGNQTLKVEQNAKECHT